MSMRSWVEVPPDSDFPLENLPYGVFRPTAQPTAPAHIGVAIGAQVLDLYMASVSGSLAPEGVAPAALEATSLDLLLAAGRPAWQSLRAALTELLVEGAQPQPDLLIEQTDVEMLLPFTVGDYVDFYSSIEHATNMGRMFRPDGEALLPNWRQLPVGYHGRSRTIVVSGAPVVRPNGQYLDREGAVTFGPSRSLDIELEVAFVTGNANDRGEPVPADAAEDHIFGLVLLNDWSARDIQRWEYVPLGPFLGKSFATTISPWVVPLEALAPYRVPAPEQDPAPLPYLQVTGDRAVDLQLEVAIATPDAPELDVISRTGFRGLYWTMAQQLAHVAVNGATVAAGDLFASGTVSGSEPGTEGSLIELTWKGERPLKLADGSTRTFLEDGDTIVLRGWCGGDGDPQGRPRIGFGECRGTISPAPDNSRQ